MVQSAKSRLFTSLSRSRTSSPNVDEYATAGSFDMHNDQILHSTVNMDGNTAQLPLNYEEHPSYVGSDPGSDGSADMSIELGRGVKRGARDRDADVSSNVVFNFGGDSQYDITGTPPIRPRNSSRKSEDLLRRQASLRNATEAAKSNGAVKRQASGTKQPSLSETLTKMNAENDASLNAEDFAQPTVTFNARNTRFTRSRQASANEPPAPSRVTGAQAQEGTPRHQPVNNPTVQSATYTANSFMLPDLPNITELVSGVRKDGTPVFNRVTNKPRSRFTSAGNYRAPSQPQHAPIESVPMPDEEKAIFASLQLLKDKVTGLEMEKAEAEKRAEEYEGEIIDLRSELQAERRRPDSALGSEDGDAETQRWRLKTRLQASLKAAQDRLDRAERKISVSEITAKRVAKERDELVTQIGVAYFNNEQLKAENETFREGYGKLQVEHEDLQEEMEATRKENQELKALLAQRQAQQNEETLQWERKEQGLRSKPEKRKETVREILDIDREIREVEKHSQRRQEPTVRSKKEAKGASIEERSARRRSSEPVEETQEDIASKIAREVQRHRSEATAARSSERVERETARQRQSTTGSRSKSQLRQASAGVERRSSLSKRMVSAPVEADLSDRESTAQEITHKTRNALKEMYIPSPMKAARSEEDDRDITYLSDFPSFDMAELRRRVEEEHLAQKAKKRNVSAPESRQQEDTMRSNGAGMPRKSSLKDITAGLDNGTGRFSFPGDAVEEAAKAAKTVRVQSPHTSDASQLPQQQDDIGDTSMLSNISRRRRRAASEDGLTSAFILPDITLHSSSQPLPTTTGSGKTCIHHTVASCTACHPTSTSIAIPTPIPVTEREIAQDPDVTSATIRPAQPPPLALATVIKNLEDEITHLKLRLAAQQRRYQQHDPALSKRQRVATKSKIESLTAMIEKRSDQVYALYDVLEGLKEAASAARMAGDGGEARQMDTEEVEETLMSIGLDPAELAGRVGRSAAPGGLDGAADGVSEGSEELPWEGESEYESEEDRAVGDGGEREKRRSAAF